MSDDVREVFDDLISAGVLIASDNPLEPPKSYQRYKIFPCRYVDKVQWSITGKCNFRCRHCLVSAPDNRHTQPTLEQCLFTVSELERCGIRKVDITGGEPFIRDDWEKIFDALAAAQIKIGIVFTNASLLDNHVLDVLEKNNQHPMFRLSFDGLGHHDWLRGVVGAGICRSTRSRSSRLGKFTANTFRNGMPTARRLTSISKDFFLPAAKTRAFTKFLSCKIFPTAQIGRRCKLAAAFNTIFLSDRKDASSRAWAFPTRSLPTNSFYRGVLEIKMADYLKAQPQCATCPHLNSCGGGCLLDGITDAGDLLVPEKRICHFQKNIGAAVVKEVADDAIAKYFN